MVDPNGLEGEIVRRRLVFSSRSGDDEENTSVQPMHPEKRRPDRETGFWSLSIPFQKGSHLFS